MIGPPPVWAGEYVGLRFAERGRTRQGCDCFGLVRLVMADRLGVLLPEFSTCGQTDDKREQAAALAEGRAAMPWTAVDKGGEQPFDVAEIDEIYRDRLGGWRTAPLHMGIVVAAGWLLHTRAATDSRLERYDVRPLSASVSRFWRWTGAGAGVRAAR